MTRFWVVHDTAFFVPYCPVRNARFYWKQNQNLLSNEVNNLKKLIVLTEILKRFS